VLSAVRHFPEDFDKPAPVSRLTTQIVSQSGAD
jgi:hypothetical protein